MILHLEMTFPREENQIDIGIKYGPEGRVANKAEELMSTRSRRKAPRTGWHQRRSFIRHTARQDILNHYYSMIRNWIEMNYMLDIGYYDRSTCLGIADCLNVEQSLTQFDHRRQTWNSERGRSHERSRSPQFKAVWLQIVSHIRKTLKHFFTCVLSVPIVSWSLYLNYLILKPVGHIFVTYTCWGQRSENRVASPGCIRVGISLDHQHYRL